MTPKGYKHTELGILPEDWEVVRLGEIGKIIGGGTPSTKKKEFWKGAIPWISSSDIDENDVFNISQTRYITQDAIDKSSTKSIEPNSILVVSRVGIGKVAINQNVLCTSQDIQALTQHNQDAFFLVYAIKNLVSLVCRINQGTSIKGFTKEVLSNLQIPLPPLAEQEKIASVLGTWDRQIQNLQSLITEKQNLKKALCQTLLTAKTRFKGFSEDWQVVRLGEVCDFLKGNGISKDDIADEGIPCIRYGELYTTYGEKIEEVFSHTDKPKEELVISKINDVVLPSSGETAIDLASASCILKEDVAIGGDTTIIRSNQNGLFLAYCLNVVCKKQIYSIAQGSSVIHLYANHLKTIKIPLPPLAEQEKIAEILSKADNEITLLEQKLESLKSQKKGLMQILLSGKVRVKWN